ncbi:MAG: hypothetical protein ACYDA9_10615 [Terriglobia bacterium]
MNDDGTAVTLEEVYQITLKYQPHRSQHWRVIEDESDYTHRMQAGPLSNWPTELLKEWLFRHAGNMEDDAFLGFEKFRFELATWDLSQLPGREAFKDGGVCDDYQNVEKCAAREKDDWLAHYMLREGTWNTPIVLLDNRGLDGSPLEVRLKSPYHLLEGHRRLSFLQGLKRLNKALPKHSIWIVRLPYIT